MASAYLVIAMVVFHVIPFADSVNIRSSWDFQSLRNFRKAFSPPEILIVSSPAEQKVSFTQLANFQSINGTVLPIMDGGLVSPMGIAWDAPRSALYVCDSSLKKIFRVKLKAVECTGLHDECRGMPYKLAVEGNQDTIVEKVLSQWAAVDNDGSLYFSDQDSHSVSKLSVEYIDQIVRGELSSRDLLLTSEPVAEGEEAARESIEGDSQEDNSTKTEDSIPKPSILRLYEKGASPNVGTPAGVVVAGPALYWANQDGGFSAGSVSYGKTSPRVKVVQDDGPTFPSSKMSNNTASAFGIAVTGNKVVYADNEQTIWASSRGTGEVVPLTKSLMKPRGLVWDGDNTVYVADQEGNSVASIPVGLLKAGAPVTHALHIHAPFGVALVHPSDPIWQPLKSKYRSGAYGVARIGALVMIIAGMSVMWP
jgi:hypothetical protein